MNAFNIFIYQNIPIADLSIKLSSSSLFFNASGGTKNIEIISKIPADNLLITIEGDSGFSKIVSGYNISITTEDLANIVAKEKNATLKVSYNDQFAICTLLQEANELMYSDINIESLSYPDVVSKGGTSTPVIGNISQTVSYTSGYSYEEDTFNLSFSILDSIEEVSIDTTTGTVTWLQNKSLESRIATIKLLVTANEKTAEIEATCKQLENYKTYSIPEISLIYNVIPASGGTVTPNLTYSQTWGWDGESSGGGIITSGGDISYSGATESSGEVSAKSKGTELSESTIVATVTVNIRLNNITGTATTDVYQEANIATYGELIITDGYVTDIPASGGTVDSAVNLTASQIVTYTSGDIRMPIVKITYGDAVTANSLSSTIKERTKVGTLIATITGEGNVIETREFDVYQEANKVISVSDYSIVPKTIHISEYADSEIVYESIDSATGTYTYTSGEILEGYILTGLRKAEEETFYSLSRVEANYGTTTFQLQTTEDNETGNTREAYLEAYDINTGTIISNNSIKVIQNAQQVSGLSINLHNETNSTCRILSTDVSIDLTPGQAYAFTIIPDPVTQTEYITYQYLDGTVNYPSLVLTGSDPNTVLLTGTQSGQTVTFIIDEYFKAYVSTMGRDIYLRERTE